MFARIPTSFTILATIIVQLVPILGVGADNSYDHMLRGNNFAKAFEHEKALDEYLSVFRTDSSNCEALWRICETYVNLCEESDESHKAQYFYLAENWANKAVEKCPESPNAHFFKAVTSGLLAIFEGGRNKVNRSREVKEAAERTLELDPNHHGAYHALGRWNLELADLNWFLRAIAKIVYGGLPPGASFEGSIENFERAIEISPNWINHHRWLGITYMKTEKWDRAREEFEKVLELPIQDHQDAQHKRKCATLLEKIKDKR